MTDIERAYAALSGKNTPYTTAFSYADGDQPLKYSTERLREAFRNINTTFNQNWIAVVVNSALDRLVFKGWSSESEEVNDMLQTVYDSHEIALESYDAHKSALITHESFIIAWKEADDELQVYYNDPRLCHMFYQADNPKKKEFACKWYKAADDTYHMTLYYPDRLEYYETTAMKAAPTTANAFKPSEIESATNPFGEIPVFHFTINRHSGTSELTNIVTLQDAVNKLLADMMVSAEFGAFKQRYIISASDTSTLRNAPNEIWQIPPGDGSGQGTQVGEFQGTDLNNFLNAIDKIANSIAIISRTPKHYFYSSGGNVSGEALIAMESPLIAKVEQYQKMFTVPWKELGAFLLKLSGQAVLKDDLAVVWEPAQSVQPLTEAQTIKTLIESTIPLSTALKWSGKSEAEIKEIEDYLEQQKRAQATQAQVMLEQLRLQNAQSNQVIPGQQTLKKEAGPDEDDSAEE